MENIKDLLSRLKLFCRLETAIVHELEKHESRLYALEENRKMKDASIAALQRKVSDLELVIRKQV